MLSPRTTLNKLQLRPLSYSCLFLLLQILIAYLNRHHSEQQSNFWHYYVGLARYWKGETHNAILTYPIWGYSLVLLMLPSYSLVLVPQVVLGAFVQTLLFFRLRQVFPNHPHLLTTLFIAAVPWYLLHSVKWPASFAGSFVVLAILLLEKAMRSPSIAAGLSPGTLFGLGMYFRSEFLYLPLFLIVLMLVTKLVFNSAYHVPLKPLAACAITAWAVLIPWAFYFHRQTGHFSLTASQAGMVAFISLGQLPNNPWNATYEDQYAYDYFRDREISLQPQSYAGDRILMNEFKRRVKAHPVAFLEKAIRNLPVTLVSGFYSGEIPLTQEQQKELAVLKRSAKSLSLASLAGVRKELGQVNERTAISFFHWIVAKTLGSLFVILSSIGLVWALIRRPLPSLLLLLAGYILYQGILLMALATEPRYLNGLYLAMVPFFIMLVGVLLEKLEFTSFSLSDHAKPAIRDQCKTAREGNRPGLSLF